MRSPTPDIPVLGVPLQWWFTLPVVVLCLYTAFRWRRFGEDTYTWNHEYFKLALAVGMTLCALAVFSARLFPESWQHVTLWAGVLVATGLTLRFTRHQDWTNTALLSGIIVALGVGSIPLAGSVGRILYHPVKQRSRDPLAGVPRATFSPEFPAGWQEQPGSPPHTYKRGENGSGILQISLFPPPDRPTPTGVDAEKELMDALDAVTKDMQLGQRVSLAHEDGAAGPLAFADYQTDTHGPVRFWMILYEGRVFASYTDGKSPVAEREIAEAHAVLKATHFVHTGSR